jgi:hypothetical protein
MNVRRVIFTCCLALTAGGAGAGPVVGDRYAGVAVPDQAAPAYELFPSAPPFEVIPRAKDSDMHPCSDCHAWAESDLTPRELDDPHDDFRLKHGLHGKGKFWCFTCHHLDDDGGLHNLEGEKLRFDDAYLVCSQCHAKAARDWYFGAHGKRVGNWRGERRLLNCTVCHYQHSPAYATREPVPPPPVRRGLERQVRHAPPPKRRVWEKYAK